MFWSTPFISEDQRFFQHEGFDWKYNGPRSEEAERKGQPVREPSIHYHEPCAPSIFLWSGPFLDQKVWESSITVRMESVPKRGVSWICDANVIEWGAGSTTLRCPKQPRMHYFRRQRGAVLRANQIAMLAAVCRIRKGWDPTKPGSTLRLASAAPFCSNLLRDGTRNFPEKFPPVEQVRA